MVTLRKHTAFSLMELLTALAIMAALIALLFPVLQRARIRGSQTACFSNLRQIGAAISLYAADYDDKIPYACNAETQAAVQKGLDIYGSPIDEQIASTPTIVTTLTPYIRQPDLFHCPLDRFLDESQSTSFNRSWYEKYGTSYAYDEAHGLLGWSLQTYPAPAQNLLFFDQDWFHQGSSIEDGLLGALFADKHVKHITWQQRTAALEANP